ncbi:MAG TPA: DUF2071 domain-containing protein [Planctomycetota bacterium]|nr:DUF2071 domain-containing protein [Planctomycetota bacterium]
MTTLSLDARGLFETAEGRPLFHAGWQRTVFIHYAVDPTALQPQVPFPLDVRDGKAYVSLVAFTLTDLRFALGGPGLTTHGFLNVRTYVPGNGIYFLAEWLPNPFCVFLGPRLYGLPYRRGRLTYDHVHETGRLHGRVEGREGALDFDAPIDPATRFAPSEPGSLDEFLLERYTAFTERRGLERLFRVWHHPWPQVPVDVTVRDDSLLAATGPWFRGARLAGANYSPGFKEVWMGRPRRRTP